MHQALGAANCSTCKLTTLQRKVGRRLSSGCEPPSFSYGTGQSLGFLFTSSVVGRRVLVLSSGWLASYVGQSEVPALITSLFCRGVSVPVSQRRFALSTFFLSYPRCIQEGAGNVAKFVLVLVSGLGKFCWVIFLNRTPLSITPFFSR